MVLTRKSRWNNDDSTTPSAPIPALPAPTPLLPGSAPSAPISPPTPPPPSPPGSAPSAPIPDPIESDSTEKTFLATIYAYENGDFAVFYDNKYTIMDCHMQAFQQVIERVQCLTDKFVVIVIVR